MSPAPKRSSLPARRADGAAAFKPLYRKITQLIVQDMQAGVWKPGEMIPSEFELADRFGVSQGTVRKAIDDLAAENLLTRRQGKGTFVATHAEQTTRYRFLRLAADDGSGRDLQRRLLHCRRMRAGADIARPLELKSGDPVVFVRRLLLAESRPVVLDDIWLPGRLFKDLTAERLAAYEGPMYALFEAAFGVQMIRAEEKIRAVAATPESAALLAVTVGSPLLSVERRSLTYGERPVELRRGLYRTDAHHYRNELQ
ncbi:MAG TPA: GntR family transcriptional regulator [Burkholderiaceae bacterium]|nr:GntR family transcriptional regulator [Burkholderiaceae bacterium]